MNKKVLPILLVLIMVVTMVGAVSAANWSQVGTATYTLSDGTTGTAPAYQAANGAIHIYITGYSSISTVTYNGVTWNVNDGKYGADMAGIPAGYNGATWHFVYTPSGILTLSSVAGVCPICPPCPPCPC